VVLVAASSFAQWPPQTIRIDDKYSSRPFRSNELTLAGLKPGIDTLKQAKSRFKLLTPQADDNTGYVFHDVCIHADLFVETDAYGRIGTLRIAKSDTTIIFDCDPKAVRKMPPLKTGRGLSIFDPTQKVVLLYGEPTSRSPSTKNGQPLELLYYAFDWAGPDVPQVMEVVCTAPKDGTPGRVVEITLAAGSL
jgi:hypothetical protein